VDRKQQKKKMPRSFMELKVSQEDVPNGGGRQGKKKRGADKKQMSADKSLWRGKEKVCVGCAKGIPLWRIQLEGVASGTQHEN